MNAETVFRKPPGAGKPGTQINNPASERAAMKEQWKTLVDEANATWSKLQIDELAKVHGNFQALTELLRSRYKLGQDSAERQARAFFDRHYGAQGRSLRPV